MGDDSPRLQAGVRSHFYTVLLYDYRGITLMLLMSLPVFLTAPRRSTGMVQSKLFGDIDIG